MAGSPSFGKILLLIIVLALAGSVSRAQEEARKEYKRLFEEKNYPSANTCKTCHPQQYKEWSVSQHAYAQLSPIFNAMHATTVKITNGTNGDFCIRCHSPVGMNREESVFMSNMDRHPASREGITCIVCHRLAKPYGKVSGRLAIVKGDLFEPVYGPTGNKELKRVIESGEYNVNTNRNIDSRNIHTDVIVLEQMSTSGFCATCHDVNLVNGFRLEEAFSDFKTSPASSNGVSCQDCHMGKTPGKAEGYNMGPAAIIGGKPTRTRKITNHMFAGPDYSVIHPGLFPHNLDAVELATMQEWLTFDYKSGWGKLDWEKKRPKDIEFPPRWRKVEDRIDARRIIDENESLLKEIEGQRRQVLEAGYKIGDIVVDEAGPGGISFSVQVKNGMDGHSIPTGFDAERVVFLRVTVSDKDGNVVFKSGDFDPNGDLRDDHSLYVHNGELPADEYLFSLQSKFLVRMVRGGEREQVLPLNFSPSPLPFLRPSTSSTFLLGRPIGARKHRKVIPPLEDFWADYDVDADAIEGHSAPFTAHVELVAGMVPINLIAEIQGVGFDYNMSPREIAKGVLAGYQTIVDRKVDMKRGRYALSDAPSSEQTKKGN